jgi:hypothetical protein
MPAQKPWHSGSSSADTQAIAHLVCSADKVQIVPLQEVCDAVWPKGVADTAVVLTPSLQQQSASRPHERRHLVAHHTCTMLPPCLPDS